MKTLLLIVLCIFSASCVNKECLADQPTPPEYNVQRDLFINSVIANKPESIKNFERGKGVVYILQYKEIRIYAHHQFFVPFEQPDQWEYYCTDKNGNDISIQSSKFFPSERVSEKTLQKIQDICEGAYLHLK